MHDAYLRYDTQTNYTNTDTVVCLKFKCSIDFKLSLLVSN